MAALPGAREAMIPGKETARLPEAVDRMIELYTDTDQPDELQKWQVERARYPLAAAAATENK